jgi:hypothetical protein
MERDSKSSVTRIQTGTPESPVTISFKRRDVSMFWVFEHELDNIGSTSVQSNLHLAFFGVFAGGALALGITLNTVKITDALTYAAYWGGFIVALALAMYFGVRAFLDWRKSAQQIKSIKEGSRNIEP